MIGIKEILIIILFCGVTSTLSAAPLSFVENEKLVFNIRWSFIPAGTAILETHQNDEINGQKARHFSLTARTNETLDLFYKFREEVHSYVDLELGKSLLYKKRQSGRSKRDIVVSFDWQNNIVQYTNFNKPNSPIELPPGTLDPLSALYFLRTQPLAEDQVFERPVTDGKKIVMGHAKVIKREKIKIKDRFYDTYKLEPNMKDVRGVFEKSKNAKMHIWITADERNLLVKLKSKVVIGSFVAELVEQNYPENNNGEKKGE